MSSIKGPLGRETTATERMEAARRARQNAQDRETLWACYWANANPRRACLMEPRTGSGNGDLPWLLVLDTPAGRMLYRPSLDILESGLLSHLEQRQNDGKPADAKEGVLLALAQSCTFSE